MMADTSSSKLESGSESEDRQAQLPTATSPTTCSPLEEEHQKSGENRSQENHQVDPDQLKPPSDQSEEPSDSLEKTKVEDRATDRIESTIINPTTPPENSSSSPESTSIPNHQTLEPKTESKPHTDETSNPSSEPQSSCSQPTTTDPIQTITPQIQELANMFPQIQPTILEAVLAAHGNDTTACVSDLLAMSDPTYRPSEQEVMEKSDEELARQLALQDNQQADYSSHQHSHHNHSDQYQHISNLPYQPRIKKNPSLNRNSRPGVQQSSQQDLALNQNQQAYPAADGKDEIQKIAEEIGKLAESGKKTMTLWFSKAKAKMQEIQQPAQSVDSSRSIDNFQDDYEHIHRPSSTSPSSSIYPNANLGHVNSSASKNTRITPDLPYGSRYQSSNPSSQSAAHSGSVPGRSNDLSLRSSKGVQGYTVEDSNSSYPKDFEKLALDDQHKSTAPTMTALTSQHSIPGFNPSSTVSSSTPTAHPKIRDDDEESLEYTRNPFEDDD